MKITIKITSENLASFAIFALILLLSACKSTEDQPNNLRGSSGEKQVLAGFSPRAENKYLTQEQAFKRSERVSNVSYNLNFSLTGKKVSLPAQLSALIYLTIIAH